MRKCPCGEVLAIGIRQGRPRRFCSPACRKRAWRQRRAVPRKMRATPRWIRWTLEPRGDKFAKVPRQLNGRHASVQDPRHWASFAAARASRVGEGIGWVLGAGVGCIDLDHCIVDGRLQPWAAEIIDRYRRRALLIERSFSGDGVHIFMRMKPGAGRRIRDGRNIEVYPPDSGRYIAVTGRRFDLDGGGVVVDRDLKPCGTPAAARRHRRRGEPVCDECRTAEREATALARAAKRSEAREAAAQEAEVPLEDIDQLTELRFMYGRIRGALLRAEPKEVATLVKQGDQILARIAELSGTPEVQVSAPAGDELDQFRQSRQERREERLAAR
ncbi:hypothetical protein ACFU1Q_11445 [Brachybacterium paraconglomeratum]